MEVKGISYAVDGVPADVVRRDLRVIAEELHCTAVMLIGAETGPHIAAARYALEAGLDVWVRPHLPDRPR
ncbi:hypothetical protein ACFQ07_02320, partial [Actinomadura adrarensis]